MSKIGQLRARKTRVHQLHKRRGKKPERIKPILITRGLKTKKNKKLKQISSSPWRDARGDESDLDPVSDDGQKPPASFREMMVQLNVIRNNLSPYRYASNEGDTIGCRKKSPERIPAQGKKETPESYARRLDRCVQEELLKVSRAKKDKAPMVNPETFKSNKTKKALKHLADKKAVKKAVKVEKRRTGFEHLKDIVNFAEVVKAPPTLATVPKKVGRRIVPFPDQKSS
ncbi:hypothetical protein Aperf_G00000079713 [Anoplocephala perfoliata]